MHGLTASVQSTKKIEIFFGIQRGAANWSKKVFKNDEYSILCMDSNNSFV